jgi:hypothetical protein
MSLVLPVRVRLRLELASERGVLLVQLPQLLPRLVQGFGSGFGLDPDWIRIRIGSGFGLDPDSVRSVHPDPDPYSEYGSVFGIRIRIQEGKNDPQK